MNITADRTVAEIATEAPMATRVFARLGIDFCCGGGVSLREACEKRALDPDAVVAEIAEVLEVPSGDATRWDEVPLESLIEHILASYHRPLDSEMPRIEQMAARVVEVHGDKDPALAQILAVYSALRAELEMHMMKEEKILFPLIQRGQGAMADGPISVMQHEHDSAGDALRQLRTLTNDYAVPEGACNTWRALWAGLEALETSLHEHIHLENNILFPRALAS